MAMLCQCFVASPPAMLWPWCQAPPKERHLLMWIFSLSIPGLDWGDPSRLHHIPWEPREGQLPLDCLQC